MKSSNSGLTADAFVLVGRITGAHGVRGALKVVSYAESIDLYEAGKRIRIVLPDGEEEIGVLSWAKPHGRGLLVGIEAVTNRNLAEKMAGAALFVDKSRLPPLEEDTYYWSDLLGLTVVDRSGRSLGVLDAVIPTAGNDVYVVKGVAAGAERELLLPAIASVIVRVDLARQTMVVDPPAGL